MPTIISQNYSRFYKGTESLKSYGSNDALKKDTLVKYEFNTTDENGNKIMDKMSKEETLRAMKEISAQYGDNVIVEFSGDGMAALVENKRNRNGSVLDEIMKPMPERQAAMDDMVTQLENTHRIIIPNIQTNQKLYNSLSGADENVIKAANGIITNYFLPGSVSGMTKQERQDMIAFGMEEANYIAAHYLEGEKAKEFLSAMETIAKYGMNGTVSEDGTVKYDIKKGPGLGGAAGYVDTMDVLKEKDPDLYREMKELNNQILNHKDGESYAKRWLELMQKAEKVLASSSDGKLTNREVALKSYADWEEKTEKTELPSAFKNTQYNDLRAFFDSLRGKSSLSQSWLDESMNRFRKWLVLD
ncbi:MAG: hypothetical protein J1E35_02455 [Lachnospiraceae bacterium]|nr:hypothetical protein [Lachnospiraceae bacterium]